MQAWSTCVFVCWFVNNARKKPLQILSNKVLKEIITTIAGPQTYVLNLGLQSGTFPQALSLSQGKKNRTSLQKRWQVMSSQPSPHIVSSYIK